MEKYEEFLDRINCQLTASGMHLDKQVLKDHLLASGEERFQLICWALSELDIKVKESDITKTVIECGLCWPANPDIVLGKCSAEENFEFWKRLFHQVRMYREGKSTSPTAYRNICKFWLELAANPELKDVLQPKKRKNILPLKVPADLTKNVSMDELLKEKVLQEYKLRDMEKEKGTYQASEDMEKYCSSSSWGTEEIEKLKQQVATFKNDMANFLMLWIADTPRNPELDGYNELIPDLASKVEKLRVILKEAAKISAALEEISTITLEESSGESLALPYLQEEN